MSRQAVNPVKRADVARKSVIQGAIAIQAKDITCKTFPHQDLIIWLDSNVTAKNNARGCVEGGVRSEIREITNEDWTAIVVLIFDQFIVRLHTNYDRIWIAVPRNNLLQFPFRTDY